ncbi:MAG TPA: hypothetical protein VLL76_07870 [Candidatus Omnitrophota bacterium]|nr:hypothetical protein [Candidatus Omnitrophota bacterium]
MILSAARARLESATGSPLRHVGGAISLAAAQDNPPQNTPAGFVYPSASASDASARVNETRQRITTRFGVALFVRTANDPTGGGKNDLVEELYTWVRGVLIGWVPDPGNGQAVTFSRGYLAGFEGGGLWWAEEFTVNHYHRKS